MFVWIPIKYVSSPRPSGPPTRTSMNATRWQVKVELCGEDEASLPIKAEDVKEALSKGFLQMVPGAKDLEGRQVRSRKSLRHH